MTKSAATAPIIPDVVHLHCLWHLGAARSTAGVVSGIVLCGQKGLPKGHFTADVKAVTCPACLQRATAPPPAPGAVGAGAAPGAPAAGGLGHPTGHLAAPAPALRNTNARGKASYPAGAVIVMAIKHNIRKAGTAKHARFAVLLAHHGKTYGEYLKAGGNAETLRNAVNEALCEVQE
jgi:hypothetical protein